MKKFLCYTFILFPLFCFAQPKLNQNDQYRMQDFNYIENIVLINHDKKTSFADLFSYKIHGYALIIKPYFKENNNTIDSLVGQAVVKLKPDNATYDYDQNYNITQIVFSYNKRPKWMKGDHWWISDKERD